MDQFISFEIKYIFFFEIIPAAVLVVFPKSPKPVFGADDASPPNRVFPVLAVSTLPVLVCQSQMCFQFWLVEFVQRDPFVVDQMALKHQTERLYLQLVHLYKI